MSKLNGKVAIVTGASKGIGAGIAERLAADGATVVVNYSRSAKEAAQVVERIESAGGKAVAVQADISQPADIAKLFDTVKKDLGRLDILINNAGIYEFGGLETVTPEHIDRQFNLNVKGLILATQAAARMFPPTGGVVVNISSVVGRTPVAAAPVYSSTKGAVDVLTRAFALELGPRNIRVIGIGPGMTATEGTSGMDQGMIDSTVARTPLGRLGEPKDIAASVSYVVSDDAAWITGETILVGGGLLL